MAHPWKDKASETIKVYLRDAGSKEWDKLENHFLGLLSELVEHSVNETA